MSARTVEIPRPEKVLFGDRITKADLAGYYEHVADAMLGGRALIP